MEEEIKNNQPQNNDSYLSSKNKRIFFVILIASGVIVLSVVSILGYIFFTPQKNVANPLNKEEPQNSKSKFDDARIESEIRSLIPEAQIYYGSNGDSFSGYSISKNILKEISCDSNPIMRISADGQSIAVFGKLCSDSEKYFCADATQNIKTGFTLAVNEASVDKKYIESGASVCDPNYLNSAIKSGLFSLAYNLDDYKKEKGTFLGFSKEVELVYSINQGGCNSPLKIDISPAGDKYVIHQPLCDDSEKSFCLENNLDNFDKMENAVIVESKFVERFYHCK